jgi:hypothetical protein
MAIILSWLAVVLSAPAGEVSAKTQFIQGTSGSRTDSLEIHAGGLVVREGEAGSAFGTLRAGKGKRRLSYFVVFKHRLNGEGKSDFTEEATAEDAGGESKQTLTIDGKVLRLEYKVKLDPGTKKVASETLVVNGKSVDVSGGRVFLVDLTTSPPKWEQRKLNLPDDVAEVTSKKAAEELTRKVLASLAKQDRKAKAFVESAGK